ncbi:hypothetical protein TgHK011_005692 [Trichoderma gracile]|nr:hypothetical protein TgHK011_005692 [Trichoderma gracile]
MLLFPFYTPSHGKHGMEVSYTVTSYGERSIMMLCYGGACCGWLEFSRGINDQRQRLVTDWSSTATMFRSGGTIGWACASKQIAVCSFMELAPQRLGWFYSGLPRTIGRCFAAKHGDLIANYPSRPLYRPLECAALAPLQEAWTIGHRTSVQHATDIREELRQFRTEAMLQGHFSGDIAPRDLQSRARAGLFECLKDVRDRTLDATTAPPESVCAM